MFSDLLISDFEKVNGLSDPEFYSNFAFIMHAALVKDVSLYTDLVDKMYEICEHDEEVLKDVLERAAKAQKIVMLNFKEDNNTPSPLSFGFSISQVLSKVLKDKFNPGEYLSLGCVAQSYISYKKNWLNKDEFYEIRDMFVPFYLPISVEMLDIDTVISEFIKDNEVNPDGNYTFVLLKKIGKTVIDRTVTVDDIKDAINELNFDEAW